MRRLLEHGVVTSRLHHALGRIGMPVHTASCADFTGRICNPEDGQGPAEKRGAEVCNVARNNAI